MVDSKFVTKALRDGVGALLSREGFSRLVGRTVWRYRSSVVDVINFQSWNSYHAAVLGCTTHSFSVNIGCFVLPVPPWGGPVKSDKVGRLRPQEAQCQFRLRLRRSLPQDGFDDDGIWYVDTEGAWLPAVITDVCGAIARDAIPWFQRFGDLNEVLRTLLEDDEDMRIAWGFGGKNSSVRDHNVAYVARFLGMTDISSKYLHGRPPDDSRPYGRKGG